MVFHDFQNFISNSFSTCLPVQLLATLQIRLKVWKNQWEYGNNLNLESSLKWWVSPFFLIEFLPTGMLGDFWKFCLFSWSKVKGIKQKVDRKEEVVELPQPLKQKLINEIIELLRELNGAANATLQHGRFIFGNFTCDDFCGF